MTSFFRRLRARLRYRHFNAELKDELDVHRAMAEDELRASGEAPDDVRRQAARQLGNVTLARESARGVWLAPWLESVWQDVRYAVRGLRRTPGFTTAAVLTIALGIGTNTAVFSVVHALLLKPLPYRDSDRLVRLVSTMPPDESSGQPFTSTGTISVSDLLKLRTHSRALAHVGVYANSFKTMTGTGSTARLEGWGVEPALFDMLGEPPMLGRVPTADDSAVGAGPVVLLSEGTWQTYFGRDPGIVGRSVALDGVPHIVTGVMRSSFVFPYEWPSRQFWLPLTLSTDSSNDLAMRLPMLAGLVADVSMAEAVAEVNAILREPVRPATYEWVRLRDEIAEPLKPALLVLMTAVGLVLLVACVNVVSLLLARSTSRVREMGVRTALGAGRARLTRQLLTEALLLSALGMAAGIALAVGAIRLLQTLAATLSRMDMGPLTSFPRLDEVAVDLQVLGFTAVVALAIAIASGLLPAIGLLRSPLTTALRSGTTTTGGPQHRRLRSLLVAVEVAAAMIVLTGGGLLVNSFVRLASVPLGYDPLHVLTFQVALPDGRYQGQRIQDFAEELVARLRRAPGVQSAAYAPLLPMVRLLDHTALFRRTPNLPATPPSLREDLRGVSRDYFKVMGIGVVAGRAFDANDRTGQPPVVVVNQALARRDFRGEDPIGQMVYLTRQPNPWRIVGIVEDVRQVALGEAAAPQVFVDSRQWPGMAPGLRFLQYYAVRTTGAPLSVVPHVRDVLSQLDGDAALYHVAPMEQLVANSVSRPRLYAAIVGAFGAVAAILAAIGIYGTLAYAVAQRTREIGIRMALGAHRRQVVWIVIRQGMVVTAVGLLIGLAGAMAATRVLEGMLFGVTTLDPATFAAVALLFALVSAVACYVPARRAASVSPLIALRSE